MLRHACVIGYVVLCAALAEILTTSQSPVSSWPYCSSSAYHSICVFERSAPSKRGSMLASRTSPRSPFARNIRDRVASLPLSVSRPPPLASCVNLCSLLMTCADSDTRPPGYGSTHAYLANEKAQSGMSPMLTRHYPGRPATPPAVQVRDGFPTTPSYDSLAYHDEKLPVYVVEDTV